MGAGRTIGRLGMNVLGAAYKAQGAVTSAIPSAVIGAGSLAGKGITRAVGQKRLDKGGSAVRSAFIKKGDKTFMNGYTGYSASGLTNTTATLGALGVVGVAGVFSGAGKTVGLPEGMPGLNGIQTRTQKVGTVSYGGAPSVMSADGVGTSTQAPNLGASGNLVFGLHNGRKG